MTDHLDRAAERIDHMMGVGGHATHAAQLRDLALIVYDLQRHLRASQPATETFSPEDPDDGARLIELRGAIDEHIGWADAASEERGDYLARVRQVGELLRRGKDPDLCPRCQTGAPHDWHECPDPKPATEAGEAKGPRDARFASDRNWENEAIEELEEAGLAPTDDLRKLLAVCMEQAWIDGQHWGLNTARAAQKPAPQPVEGVSDEAMRYRSALEAIATRLPDGYAVTVGGRLSEAVPKVERLVEHFGALQREAVAKDARIAELESALRDITEDRRRDGERIGELRTAIRSVLAVADMGGRPDATLEELRAALGDDS